MGRGRPKKDNQEIKDLQESEKIFHQIRGMNGFYVIGGINYDVEEEFNRLRAMYKLAEMVYATQDGFTASSWCYEYILPRVNALLRYIEYGDYIGIKKEEKEEWIYVNSKNKASAEEQKRVRAWCSEKSQKTTVKCSDGSEEQLIKVEYLYRIIRKKCMAMAGRFFMHYNIQYLEMQKSEKSYPRRMRVLRSAVWWANQMLLNIFGKKMPDGGDMSDVQPQLIIFSTMPSSGKSFVCNTMNEMFMLLARELQQKGGCLRVGNEQGNILGQSRQTINLILNPLILDMYPELKKYVSSAGKFMPFEKGAEEEWSMKGATFTPTSSIFKTRDSAINSVRCQLGMFDDPSRGQQESSNMTIHTRICNLFNGDFQDRFESQGSKRILLTGTMFNPEDVFSTEMSKALQNGYIKDLRFKNTFVSMDKKVVVIVNDCEDEYGNSAFPEFISDEDLQAKRNSLPEYDYRCIWRQKPIPADGLVFAKEFLSFYDELPPKDEFGGYAMASLDPTRRKANDFLSMPIFRYHEKSGKYYLVDIIYQRKSILQLYDRVIDKIFMHKIVKLAYEENTDTSLGVALTDKIKARNPNAARIVSLEQVYNTENKLARINNMAQTIIHNIVFPSEKAKNPKSELGFAVHQLINFDGNKNEHDDFPDSLAMFADKIIVNANSKNYLKPHRNRPF